VRETVNIKQKNKRTANTFIG